MNQEPKPVQTAPTLDELQTGGKNSDAEFGQVVDEAPEEQISDDGVDQSTKNVNPNVDSADKQSTIEPNESVDPQPEPETKKFDFKSLKTKLKEFWADRRKRYTSLATLALIIIGLAIWPASRAWALNLVGVRSAMTIVVSDKASKLPIVGAEVSIGGSYAKTNASGQAKLKNIKLGNQQLVLHKVGFADYKKQMYMGVRVVDYGEVQLRPIGAQLRFKFHDFLTHKPVTKVQVSSGEATAESDEDGQVVLTLEAKDSLSANIKIEAKTYRTEQLKLMRTSKNINEVKLVPAAHAYYISKRSGRYDVYQVDIDGKNQKVVLPGTGFENQSMKIAASHDNKHLAVSSTRAEKRNSQGYLLGTLTLVDTETGLSETIEQAEQISIIGWHGNNLIFQETVNGYSAANPNRQKIYSYDPETNDKKQLASANYFADYILVGGRLYYAVSATDPSALDTFIGIDIDGKNKKSYYTNDVWSIVRVSYIDFRLQTPGKWLSFMLSTNKLVDSTPPIDMTSIQFNDNFNGTQSLWVDQRDNEGVLMNYNVESGKNSEITIAKWMQNSVGWLNETTAVYRVSSASENADYVVSLMGGSAVKVADVSNTANR